MPKTDRTAAKDPLTGTSSAGHRPPDGLARAGADELCFLPARELLRRYRARSLSPVEVTRAVLDRIADVNPHINALYYIDAERALAATRDAERRWHRGAPMGALDGVPVTLKDSVRAAGMPTPNGTRALADRPDEPQDSPVTARLREHGAIIVGKTTMPDFGMIPSGISSLHGVTRNPWNPERNPGGSSSGAGAAVASGLGPLAVGSDIGGSIRIPAAFCGIVGLKPSYGRVPIADPWPALVAGPMARSVADVALLLRVISGPDARDYTSLPWDDRDYLDRIDTGVRGLRIGLLTDMGFGPPVHPEIRSLIEAAAGVFTSLGAVVTPMPPVFDEDPEPDFDHMMQAYGWADFSTLPPERQALVLPQIAEWCRKGERMSAAELTRATAGIGQTRRRVIATCAAYDYVIGPTMAIEPFAAELPWAPGGTQHNPFCFPFNLSEQPALSLCCGFTAGGLPVGLQIIGRRFDDAGVLRVAHAYEAARVPLRDVPLRDVHDRRWVVTS
jgi:Asp-tRNA(Asn)/Glu-tRNA(Gln) amidotransferase A subunit family amidase